MGIAQEQDLLETVTTSLPEVQRIVVFAPHPDDEVFGCGGTIYRLVQGGARVQIHIVTDGALGGQPPSADMVALRQAESCSAAAILGQLPPLFWKLPDRSLLFCEALVGKIQKILKDDPVDLLFAPAPSEIHPDHQALGLACAEAVRRLGGTLKVAFYEIGAPLARANLLIDISAVETIKAKAMECFTTQLADQPYSSRIRGLNQFRGHLLGAEVAAAEAFLLVNAAELSMGLQSLFDGPMAQRRRLGYVADLKDQPLVSVIIRSMDRPYLDEALGSLSLQLYLNIEVIVVNAKGGEHRPLGSACGRYPLRLINQNGSPLGRSSAANNGLKACRGEFISFLDDDDVILPDHLHGLLQLARKKTEPVAVYAETIGMGRNDPSGAVLLNFVETEINFTKLLLGNVLPIHSVLFPASVLSSGVAFDETLDLYENWDFWLQLLLQIPFVSVAQQTAIYYLGGDSGISPLDPDPKKVSQTVARLYTKWREWITPETLVQMRQLYHEHSETFVRREAELSRQLHQGRQQYEETDKKLHQSQRELANKDAQLHQSQRELANKDAQLHQSQRELANKDAQLHQSQRELASKDAQLTEQDQLMAAQQQQLAEQARLIHALKEEIALVFASHSWKMTEPPRRLSRTLRRMLSSVGKTRNIVSARGGLSPFTKKAVEVICREGISSIKGRLAREDATLHLAGTAPTVKGCPTGKLKIIPHYLPTSGCPEGNPALPVSIAVHLHLFYPIMLATFASRLAKINRPFDLYVSVPQKSESRQIKSQLQERLPHAERIFVETVPNRGRDIAPLIIQFGERLCRYQMLAHFHTKKSPHCEQLDNWCRDILDLLLGAEKHQNDQVEQIIELLQTSAKLIYPQGQTQIIKDKSGWGGNYTLAKSVLERYTTLKIEDFPVVEFSEGSMFWARSEAIREFLTLPLSWRDFPAEPIAADGTLAHALERLLLIFANAHPGDFYRLHLGDSIPDYRYYEEQLDYSTEVCSDVKVLSYYLPQFHPIPENDLWHGKGFTEWTKVRAANPLFEGHYQQHIPHPDIGYYLLDSPDTLHQQADMMRQAGVYGQVFYHYWFTGKLILAEPAQMLLDNPNIAMPFCFCWANENWTRRWDGNEDEILLEQKYSEGDARAFIQYLIPFFSDTRYLRVENRPVLFVYRPASIPPEQNYLKIWADECLAQGLPSPYVVAVLTRGATSPVEFGMDAGVERVMHDWTDGAIGEQKHNLIPYRPLRGSILSYPEVAEFYAAQKQAKPFTWFRSLVPIWDNTARYGEDAYLLHGSTPDLFAGWLKACVAHARQHLSEDRRFVVINAWNEWAEGAHLEPDSRYGYAYLNSVGRTLAGISPESRLNPQAEIPVGTHVRITFPPGVEAAINADSRIKYRFVQSLAQSTFLKKCRVDCDSAWLQQELSTLTPLVETSKDTPAYLLQIRRPVLFDSHVVEKMLQSAITSRDSTLLSNTYDRHSPLVEALDSGGVDAAFAYAAPVALIPVNPAQGYRNYRIRGDALSFPLEPDSQCQENLPKVTTIIRYHKTGTLAQLTNALNCLRAMQNCLVVPYIVTQDLSNSQQADLERLLDSIDWPQQTPPHLEHHKSEGGHGDLRAQLLTETLKKVQTRYAAFLDYDDLLMSHAYSYLINRLETTGKAVSFGRVYSTTFNGQNGLFLERQREFIHGRNYADFFACNHAPLHSFLLDLSRLDITDLSYHPAQCYLEDYYLTLQLITADNTDWQSLGENCYIGDYLHNLERGNTLAFSDRQQHAAVINSPSYQACVQRIAELKVSIRHKTSS